MSTETRESATALPSSRVFPRPSDLAQPQKRLPYAWAGPLGWLLSALAGGATLALALAGRVSYLGALLVVAVLAGSGSLLKRLGVNDHGANIEALLRCGLGLKLLVVLPRFELRQDAVDYHAVGRTLAREFRQLNFLVDTGRSVPGTGTVRYMTGLVEVVTFDDEFATFVLFALFGFTGLVLYVRAFVVALPSVNPVRYVALIMLWPSLAYWPASTGKEAVVTFGLGLVAYALARLLTGRYRALLPLAAGLALAGLVRPHVALIAVSAAVGALVLHSRCEATGGIRARLLAVVLLAAGGAFLSDGAEQLFKIEDLNVSSVSAALDLANYRSSQGGSTFVAARIDGLADVPWGVVTVLFRPLPNEATTVAGLVASTEGVILMGLLFGAISRVVAAVPRLRQEAYVVYAVAFVCVFVFLFSALGNFGILTRQRTMMTPLLLVLAGLPTARERVRARRAQVSV